MMTMERNLEAVFPAKKQSRGPAATEPVKTLKGYIADDLIKGAVWFTDTEMAEYHDINGARILCLFDKYEMAMAAAGNNRSTVSVEQSGIQADMYLLFIRADEYNGTPRREQEIKVDGRKFYVVGAIEYDGVYEITLSARLVR